MKLSEGATKEILRNEGAPVPAGSLVFSANEVIDALSDVSLPVMVKANSAFGGKWKAGLVAPAASISEAQRLTTSFLGRHHQDVAIKSVLIEPRSDPIEEVFLAISIDDRIGLPVLRTARQGGVDVEIAVDPDGGDLQSLPIDPVVGLRSFAVLPVFKSIGFSGPLLRSLATVAVSLWSAFKNHDAMAIEVNPLGVMEDDSVLVLDARMTVDDNSLFRHPELAALNDEEVASDYTIGDRDVRYTDLGGNIALLSGGAGMTMAIADAIIEHGGSPANFLDTIGGANADGAFSLADAALDKVARDPNVRVLLVNLSLVASPMAPFVEGFERAFRQNPPRVPVVGIVRGTGAATASMSMHDARERMERLGIELYDSIQEAILASIRVANQGTRL